MSVVSFVDTNVLVYLRDSSDARRQARAEEWLRRLWQDRSGRLSIQVLNEFYVAVTQKLQPGLSQQEAREDIRSLFAWKPLQEDAALVRQAWLVQDRYQFSWWDALIVAAAQLSDCAILLSEDLQDGQRLDGLQIVNPFLHSPADVLA